MEGAVGPLGSRVFGAVDEDDAIDVRVEGGDTTARVVGGLVDGLGAAGLDINDLDTTPVEDFPGGVGSDVIDDAGAVWRPDASIGENAVAGSVGDLFFGKEVRDGLGMSGVSEHGVEEQRSESQKGLDGVDGVGAGG